jgi:hypothetical protein
MKLASIVYIYGLIDPETDAIFYVGKAVNVKRRFWAHTYAASNTACSKKWKAVSRIIQKGKLPRVEILEEAPAKGWSEFERFWIAYFRSTGAELTNTDPGGSGGIAGRTMSAAARRKIGNAVRAQAAYNRLIYGNSRRPETRQRLSQANTGHHRGGWTWSEESRRRGSLSQRDPVLQAARLERLKKFRHSEVSKLKMSQNMRRSPLWKLANADWASKANHTISEETGISPGSVKSFRSRNVKPSYTRNACSIQ